MDIFQALKDDHDKVKKLFVELEQPPLINGRSRETIFAKLKSTLQLHSDAEEVIFYKQLAQHGGTEQDIEHAVKEHDKVSRSLEELGSMDKKDGTWLNKLMSLHDDVQQHVDVEEGELFQKAKDIFSKRQAEDMTEQFETAKNQKAMKA